MSVDAHHHLWRFGAVVDHHPAWTGPAYAPIARDFSPADLAVELERNGVERTVLVQAVDTAAENDRLLAHAREVPFVAGIVAWLPLSDPEAARAELRRLEVEPSVRGVRMLIGRDPAGWLLDRGTRELLGEVAQRGWSWDVVPVTPAQLHVVARIAGSIPGLRIVVDHLARPPVDTGGWQPWAEGVRRLAAHPNVAVKVSVGIDLLVAWRRLSGAALVPYLGWIARHFGPTRMLLASNWPVVLLASPYADALAALDSGLVGAGLSETELAEVRGAVAERWYRLVE